MRMLTFKVSVCHVHILFPVVPALAVTAFDTKQPVPVDRATYIRTKAPTTISAFESLRVVGREGPDACLSRAVIRAL